MRGINEREAYVLSVAAGVFVPSHYDQDGNLPTMNYLLVRGLLRYSDQPVEVTPTMEKYECLITPAGRLLLTLYNQGIR